jgi:hypothetical protein
MTRVAAAMICAALIADFLYATSLFCRLFSLLTLPRAAPSLAVAQRRWPTSPGR